MAEQDEAIFGIEDRRQNALQFMRCPFKSGDPCDGEWCALSLDLDGYMCSFAVIAGTLLHGGNVAEVGSE